MFGIASSSIGAGRRDMSPADAGHEEDKVTRVSPLRLFFTALYIAAWPALLLWVSGDWRWVEGWVFAVWFLTLCASSIVWLYRRDPALLEERYRKPGSGGQSRADTLIVYGLVIGFTIWIIVTPIDAHRFAWTPRPPRWLEPVGGGLLIVSAFFLFRSFTDNTFLSPLVRIQTERKQQVVSTGVYGFVRHPMYLGAVCMFLGMPLLLGSTAGVLLGILLTVLVMVRIVGEEKLLARELEGYDDYRRRVRTRLLPYIW
jgi:protein-S-isoprenylcysteine O-methyltransferase Ste14